MGQPFDMSYEEYREAVTKIVHTEGGFCPVTAAALVLQGKWKMKLLYELSIKSPMRFGEFRKNVPNISNTMLTNALRELEEDGLVRREQFLEIPPHVEYALTEKGHDLLPIFYAMTKWGFKYQDELQDKEKGG